MPPPASSTSIAVAPASMLFSMISFRALAGAFDHSPAAIWLTRWSGRAAIRDMGFFRFPKLAGIIAKGRLKTGIGISDDLLEINCRLQDN